MKQIQKGFTLIELMIVVAIIGILAAVAIPAYQDYIVKAKLTKIQSTMDSVKIALAMYYQENGSFPQGTAVAVTNPGTAGTSDIGPDIWTSIGLNSFPVLPPEVSNMLYIGDALGDTFALVLTVAPNKVKTTIDNTLIAITPTSGNTTAAVVAPLATKPIGTAIVWEYACTSTDTVLTKYFNNAGVPCTVTSP